MRRAHNSDGNKRKLIDTDNIKENSPQKLLTKKDIPVIIQGVIPPVNQVTTDGVVKSGRDLYAVHVVIYKEIVMGATRSAVGVLKYPPLESWKDTGSTITVDRAPSEYPPKTLLKLGLLLDPLSPQLA